MRLFTPSEANATLPLVRRIVTDILETGQRMRSPGKAQQGDMEALAELFQELETVGCSYRDWSFDIGLVDFPAKIDDEVVLLCWRSDEPKVSHYHGVNAGYAGRKTIPDSLLQ